MTEVNMTAHALRTIESKGFDLRIVADVWANPDTQYPSHRYPGQHKRCGQGIALACDDETGLIITVFINREVTALRHDQRNDRDAVAWAKRNGLR